MRAPQQLQHGRDERGVPRVRHERAQSAATSIIAPGHHDALDCLTRARHRCPEMNRRELSRAADRLAARAAQRNQLLGVVPDEPRDNVRDRLVHACLRLRRGRPTRR